MCGITGIVILKDKALKYLNGTEDAAKCLKYRGPDNQSVKLFKNAALGHARLSVIDLSAAANQPMMDESGRYCLVFNGEIYNYKELRIQLESEGISFKTSGDTEVLLHLIIQKQEKALTLLDGFFAFAFYDIQEEKMLLARDRMGIKPLMYYLDDEKFIFASELNAILSYGIDKQIDHNSLFEYLRLTYIPAPHSIIKSVNKMMPGEYAWISKSGISKTLYYKVGLTVDNQYTDYRSACKKLIELLETSVQNRLVADVPLGTFLSGGIDSSIISTIAARHIKNLPLFSIGFPDEPYFDETKYAKILARQLKGEHHIFEVSNKEMQENLNEMLEHMDEPFADSSAIPVNILSKNTRKHVTVALSGDGADELFAGYNKHSALFKAGSENMKNRIVKNSGFLWNKLPGSRNSGWQNKLRQLEKYSRGLQLSEKERYWEWACFNTSEQALAVLKDLPAFPDHNMRREALLETIVEKDFNSVLHTDISLVLPNDMLKKVDMMSMAQSLEVRVPFLDHKITEFAFSLPVSFKINEFQRKRILKDAFANEIPPALLKRPKKGFEVPLANWLKFELNDIMDNVFAEKFINDQGLFNYEGIVNLRKKLRSKNIGDVPYMLWALLVFQVWYRKHFA